MAAPRAACENPEDETPEALRRRQISALEDALARAPGGLDESHQPEQVRRVVIHWLNRDTWIRPEAIGPAVDHFFEAAANGGAKTAWGYLRQALLRRHRQEAEDALEAESEARRRELAAERLRR